MILEAIAATAALTAAAPASECPPTSPRPCLALSPTVMFRVAEEAQRSADISTAKAIYRALGSNRMVEVRSEARFRLALLLISQGQLSDGATELRKVLDEQPGAQRVRLELAGVLAQLGDVSGARRELRAAQAGRLPQEVAQMVDRFSAALRARKTLGGSVAVAMASDSNINRATRSDTLGTVIGDFVLDDEAKAHAGRGIALDGQGYGRLSLGAEEALLLSISGSANLYGKSRFNDVALVARAGPELDLGRGRLNLSGGTGRRWIAGRPLTTAVGGMLDLSYPVLRVAQARVLATADRVRNHDNALETGWVFTGSTALELALSTRSGAGISLSGVRRSLRDSGYSTTAGQVTAFAYREAGKMTIVASTSAGRLQADERLVLYPEKRTETLLRGTLGATLRQLTFLGFAPTAQFTVERNRSSIAIYDYSRTAFEVGITRAF